mgnify:CR=1 FL=1
MQWMVFFVLGLFSGHVMLAQSTDSIHAIWWNLENAFDTIDQPNVADEAFTPQGVKQWGSQRYHVKLQRLAQGLMAVSQGRPPEIMAFAEVENAEVMVDLLRKLPLSWSHWILHQDSPDARGIDVALLYQKQLFTPISTSSHELKIFDDLSNKRVRTRDQLLVSGNLDGELIHVIVNHWPSRSGGEARSRPKRIGAAKLTKHLVDSLQIIDPYAKVFIMGDLNDDPTNSSIKDVLKAQKDKEKVSFKGIYNPYESMFKNGIGTTAYRDAWSLFDQILMTAPLLEKDFSTYRFYKAGIYNENFLTQKSGRFKGYPFRSFGYSGFTDGYSDHFPVYVYLIREVEN